MFGLVQNLFCSVCIFQLLMVTKLVLCRKWALSVWVGFKRMWCGIAWSPTLHDS